MIYFITVNYYSTELIKGLIASIQAGISSPYEFLIVNNSPEETAIHQLDGGQVRVIEAGGNLGFGQGCNLGIRDVWERDRQGLVWLINPDATLDPDADLHIQECLSENPSIAILGTQIRTENGSIWFTEGTFNPWTGSLKHQSKLTITSYSSKLSRPAQWVTGCSLIINLIRFQEVPEFDKNYFLYSEDADFCLRYAKQGYQVAVTNKLLVSHKVSSIIGRNIKSMYKNYVFGRLLVLKQHGKALGLLTYLIYSFLVAMLYLPLRRDQSLGRFQGMTKFVLLNSSTLPKEPA